MIFINDFFGFLYKYYSGGKGELYGFYSTIFSITALIGQNILFLQDLFLFQLEDRRDILFNFPKWEKFVVPTLIILVCYLYFKSRYIAISKLFKSYSAEQKKNIRFWSLLYIVVTIISSIFMAYSVKNNIKWW
jgi:hypothetical protein